MKLEMVEHGLRKVD